MKKIYRKIVKRVFLSLLIASLSLISMATTYYVSNSGDDNNSGQSTKLPWETLNKVNTYTFLPGDSVLLKRGNIWREFILLQNSGNLAHRIVFSYYVLTQLQPGLIKAIIFGNRMQFLLQILIPVAVLGQVIFGL